MNFTKEYIDLCKSEKIQGLRKYTDTTDYLDWLKLDKGDWVYNFNPLYKDENIDTTTGDCELDFSTFLWLPTGDQLDEEIVKICKGKDYSYNITFSVETWFIGVGDKVSPKDYILIQSPNPLIAKINLLIKLLEE